MTEFFLFIQKSFLEVVGLDAADVVRCCAVEGVHQHLQGLTELPSSKTEPKSNNTNCQSKLGKRLNSCTRYGTVRAHLEAHRQPVLSGGSFPCANAPIGHRGHVSLQLEQLGHQLRLTHRHTQTHRWVTVEESHSKAKKCIHIYTWRQYLTCFEDVDELLKDGVPVLV